MDNDLVHKFQNHLVRQHREIGVALHQLQKLIGLVCVGVEGVQLGLFLRDGRFQVLLLVAVRQHLEPLFCQVASSECFVKPLDKPVQFGVPLAVTVQLPLQFLCGVVLPDLGGGAYLFNKAFFIGNRISADCSDGV